MTTRNSSQVSFPIVSLSATQIKAELRRRERTVHRLIRERERVAAVIAEIDTQIDALGNVKVRRRPRNSSNLVEALVGVLTGKTMSLGEATDAVQAAGYQSTSPNFRTIVNQTLINKSRMFKRVTRGRYTAR
jgi:hypothetical protein